MYIVLALKKHLLKITVIVCIVYCIILSFIYTEHLPSYSNNSPKLFDISREKNKDKFGAIGVNITETTEKLKELKHGVDAISVATNKTLEKLEELKHIDTTSVAIDKAPEEIEECGCPNTNKIKRLLQKHGVVSNGTRPTCLPSNCTDYTLDISQLEKPPTPFKKYERVVMVTKVGGPKYLPALQQMICLFNAAYNRHAGYYDIIIFTTLPWTEVQLTELREVAKPANLMLVSDSPPLEEVIASMTEEEVAFLKERCGCEKNETLSWSHYCGDGNHMTNLGYAWQAEFRTYHLWKHPDLAEYRYMIWMDSDAYATKMWDIDPIKIMVENDLVVMYDHFPQGRSRSKELMPKFKKAYNQSLCPYSLSEKGYFDAKHCTDKNEDLRAFPLIHGYHHITDLNFYRSERTMRFLKTLVEDYKFGRKFDDQIAVTIPAAMDAPNRSWDYRKNGLNFMIRHHAHFGDKKQRGKKVYGYHSFHFGYNRKKWVTGAKMCDSWIAVAG